MIDNTNRSCDGCDQWPQRFSSFRRWRRRLRRWGTRTESLEYRLRERQRRRTCRLGPRPPFNRMYFRAMFFGHYGNDVLVLVLMLLWRVIELVRLLSRMLPVEGDVWIALKDQIYDMLHVFAVVIVKICGVCWLDERYGLMKIVRCFTVLTWTRRCMMQRCGLDKRYATSKLKN